MAHKIRYNKRLSANNSLATLGKSIIAKAIDMMPVAITMAKFAGLKFLMLFLMTTQKCVIFGLKEVLK